jgi:hypothetical protein|tara:strand:- start:4797 stop:5045 length:249 start_codon:yes stop_codon:yes gene_type:complete
MSNRIESAYTIWFDKFTRTERVALRASTDPVVVDLYEQLTWANNADRAVRFTVGGDYDVGLQYLVDNNIAGVDATRKAELLV